MGQELVEKGLRRYGCSYNKMLKTGDLEKVALDLKYGNVDDLVAAVGYGKVDVEEVIDRALPEDKRKKPPSSVKEGTIEKVIRRVTKPDGGIVLDGLDNLLVHFARCCNALPGEAIIGYVSHGRGIVIHRNNCPKAAVLDPARRMPVQWSTKAVSQRPVVLKLKTKNQPGVLAGVSGIFKNLKIDINSAQCESDERNQGTIILTFMVKNLGQLNHLIKELKQSSDVMKVHRL
jgi:GTP pyrophosphokinase